MKRINKILFILLLMFVYSNVKAEEESYIKVGNIQVTETNQDILGDGTVSYDADNNTLTLNNFNWTLNDEKDNIYIPEIQDNNGSAMLFYLNNTEGTNIVLNGNNTVTYNGNLDLDIPNLKFFVFHSEYKTTIKGDGTLTVNYSGKDKPEINHYFYVYASWNGILDVDGVTINMDVDTASAGTVLYSDDGANIKNSTINLETSNIEETGIFFSENDLLVENTKLNFNSNDDLVILGLYSDNIKINDVDFNMNANNVSEYGHGIYANDDLEIKNSNFNINVNGNVEFVGIYQEVYNDELNILIEDSKINFKIDNGEEYQSVGIFGDILTFNKSIIIIDQLNGEEGNYSIYGNTVNFDKGTYMFNNPLYIENSVVYNNIETKNVFVSDESFDTLVEVTDLNIVKDSHYILINVDDSTYEYLEGKDTIIEKDDTDLLKFRIDGNYILFKSLKIDGVEFILNTDYTVSEGSTIITLTNAGMTKINALDTTTHNVEATFLNNIVSTTTLTLTNDSNPNTLDNIIISILMMILSLLSLISISLYLNKEANN